MLFDGGLHGAGAAERCRGVACGGFRAAEGGVEPPCGGIAQAVKLESNDCGIGAGGRYCAGYLFGLAYIVQPGTFEVVWTAYEVQRRVELAAHQYVAGENAACQVIYVGLVVDEYGFDAGFAHYVAEAAEPEFLLSALQQYDVAVVCGFFHFSGATMSQSCVMLSIVCSAPLTWWPKP